MKRIVFILVLSLLLGACERKKETVIRMETSLGNIRLKLYDETVLHRDNILKLIREGYYNGMLFHRETPINTMKNTRWRRSAYVRGWSWELTISDTH